MYQLSVKDLIQSLDDATARRVLDSIARAQTASVEIALTPELRQALGDFATGIETATVPAGDGDLARAAKRAIDSLLSDGSPTPYELGATGFGADKTHGGDIARNSKRLLREQFRAS